MYRGKNSLIYEAAYPTEKREAPLNGNRSKEVLRNISRRWESGASVRNAFMPDDVVFDPNYPDFLIELLPFRNHPRFLLLEPALKETVLTCGWLAYNEKTLDIENKIVAPACQHILAGRVPGTSDDTSKRAVAETLVDEAYHVLMTLHACGITKRYRGIQEIRIPDSYLVQAMKRLQGACVEPWETMLIELATAIVSEVFISDYLKLLSDAQGIQPIHRSIVDTHRKDELVHSGLFKTLTKEMYRNLSEEQKEFFSNILPQPILWFANQELEVWESMLTQVGIPDAGIIIADCRSASVDLDILDYSGVAEIADELGIYDFRDRIAHLENERIPSV